MEAASLVVLDPLYCTLPLVADFCVVFHNHRARNSIVLPRGFAECMAEERILLLAVELVSVVVVTVVAAAVVDEVVAVLAVVVVLVTVVADASILRVVFERHFPLAVVLQQGLAYWKIFWICNAHSVLVILYKR